MNSPLVLVSHVLGGRYEMGWRDRLEIDRPDG
jgi:hypothetical protein